jgi:two-component system LytT family sensor kinase
VYVVFIALVTLFDHYRMSLDHKVRVAQLEAELNGLRLATLESQLQPHFLFNALNTISSVMYEDLPAADSMLASLADLLRRALRPIAQPEVPLRDELETLELYLAIMRARFADRLTIGIDVADDVRNAGVPQLLLQPLVENALLHGDPGPGIHATVTLRARHTDGHLVLEIEDNGPGLRGRPADAIENGIGLGNTARRLKHLYGDAQQLVLSTAPSGGLSVVVKIPFRQLTVAGTP